jgi:DNA-binding NtrC family response regulator
MCLLVDDEPDVRKILQFTLKHARFESLEAESAAEALEIIERLGGNLDLVVTDVKMPGAMDGIGLAHAVRTMFPDLPIILMTGFAEDETVQSGLGRFEFLNKPFGPDAMLEAVRKLVPSLEAAPVAK